MDNQAATLTIRALRAVQAQSAGEGRILSYANDFETLWDFVQDPRLLEKGGSPQSLFIVWDCVPQLPDSMFSKLAIGNFLTVFDWIAALMLAVQQELAGGALESVPALRVHILDVSDPYGYQRSPGIVSRLVFQAIAPWVTVSSFHQGQADRFLSALGTTPIGTTMQEHAGSANWTAAIKMIQSFWRGEITKAGSRHSVSNAISPITLALDIAEKFEGGGQLTRVLGLHSSDHHALRSFLLLLERLSLVPNAPTNNIMKQRTPRPTLPIITKSETVSIDMFGRFRNVKFMLVDDLAEGGFHDVLSFLLLGEVGNSAGVERSPPPGTPVRASTGNGHSLTSFASAEPLLRWVESIAQIVDEKKPRRPNIIGKWPADPQRLPEFDILFLDLRLYPEHGPVPSQEEIDAITKLLALHDDCIWPKLKDTLSSERRDALKAAIAASRGAKETIPTGEQWFKHFALLPIILSILDPSLPIVLFSSTRQRQLLELLRPFPNIITSFSKPMISGYAEDRDAQGTTIEELSRALCAALFGHEARLLWELLSRTRFEDSRAPPHILEYTRPPYSDEGKGPTPFLLNESDVRSVLDIFENAIICGGFYEALLRPFEVLEASLLAAHGTNSEIARIHFREKLRRNGVVVYEFSLGAVGVEAADVRREHAMMRLCDAIKKVRNAYSHGAFVGRTDKTEVVRFCALTQLYLFIACINRDERDRFVSAARCGWGLLSPSLDTILLSTDIEHLNGLLGDFARCFRKLSKWSARYLRDQLR